MQWEYITRVFVPSPDTGLDNKLRIMGEEGWELVTTTPGAKAGQVCCGCSNDL